MLYDVLGRPVKISEVNSLECQLDVTGLPSGTYFLKIVTLSGTLTERLLKH